MSILKYIFYLGIIHLVFGFVWKWVVTLPTSILFALVRFDKGVFLIKSIGAYFLVSLTLILVLTANQDKGIFLSIIYYSIGGLVLFVSFTSNTYEAQKQAAQNYDYEMMDLLEYDTIITIGSLILFIVVCFVPSISVNTLTIKFFGLAEYILDMKIIGWLVSLGGVLFLLSMFLNAIIYTSLMFISIGGIFRRNN